MDAVLVGRSDPQDYVVSGADWGSQPDGVYAYQWANLKAGSQVEATFRDGTTKIFTVVGSYDINYRSISLYPPIGLLMTAEAFTRVARPDALTYFVQVAPDQVSRAATALGAALPQATVVNLVAYAARFMQSYQNLFVLPMAMAGLALLAGFLLVANSVSLAMLDRRYEIGILKTVGYSRRQILAIFAVEYGLVGLLATGAGVLLVQGLLAVLAIATHLAASVLLLSLPSLALIALCGVGLTLLTVFGVTWNPTRVSPVVVLNERNWIPSQNLDAHHRLFSNPAGKADPHLYHGDGPGAARAGDHGPAHRIRVFARDEHRYPGLSLGRGHRAAPAGALLPAARRARSGRAADLAPGHLRRRVRQPAAAGHFRQPGCPDRQERPDVRDLPGRDRPGGRPGQRKKPGGAEVQPALERGPQPGHPRQCAADRTSNPARCRRSSRMGTT